MRGWRGPYSTNISEYLRCTSDSWLRNVPIKGEFNTSATLSMSLPLLAIASICWYLASASARSARETIN